MFASEVVSLRPFAAFAGKLIGKRGPAPQTQGTILPQAGLVYTHWCDLRYLPEGSGANGFSESIVSIAGGDTITFRDTGKVQHKVRLEGIDAPEKVQAFGTKNELEGWRARDHCPVGEKGSLDSNALQAFINSSHER